MLYCFCPLASIFVFKEHYINYLTLKSFIITIVISFAFGFFLKSTFKSKIPDRVTAILICGLGWIVISLFGAIPFVLITKMTYLDAYFETVSGFTTTGITMLTNIEVLPESLLIWRHLIQWVGGLGILTFFLAVFSQAGEHRIFSAESHKINMKRIVPGFHNTIKILWLIYLFFTVLIYLLLILSGSSVFDSITHALTTLSTGGFSPYDASIAHYANINHPNFVLIEYIIIFGMFLGGTNFLIHYRLLRGDVKALWDNLEIRYWFRFIFIFLFLIMLERFVSKGVFSEILRKPEHAFTIFESNFRNTLFQVISIITTTGYATKDINSPYFGHVARQLFLVMMVIGGCVGSTGGGFKVMRVAILFKMIGRELYKTIAPKKAITYVIIDEKSLDRDEIFRIGALFFAWISLLFIGGVITSFFSDFNGYKAFSGMFSSLGNIGPCFQSVKEMSVLHPVIKLTYIFGMLAGRLEILPILLLFNPRSWR